MNFFGLFLLLLLLKFFVLFKAYIIQDFVCILNLLFQMGQIIDIRSMINDVTKLNIEEGTSDPTVSRHFESFKFS